MSGQLACPLALKPDTIYERENNMSARQLGVEEILGNPDSGLELREEVKERVSRSLAAMQGGEERVAIEQVARMLRRGKGNE